MIDIEMLGSGDNLVAQQSRTNDVIIALVATFCVAHEALQEFTRRRAIT